MTRKKHLKVTGERYVPDDIRTSEEHLGLLRHIFVYEHVKKRLEGTDKVLEIGFGEGYGTRLLSDAVGEIVGIDVEQTVVDYALDKYASSKCKYMHYDGSTVPYPDETFDVVISFQVIEHIVNDAAFIAEVYRVLKTGGRFYITTPNRTTRLKPGQKPWNRFHVREYYPGQLADLLQVNFGEVKVLGVSATDEIHRMEIERIKQGFFLSLALKLGLRNMIPESLDAVLARLRGRLKGQKRIPKTGEAFKSKFSLDDFRVEEIKVEESLDLLGVCRK